MSRMTAIGEISNKGASTSWKPICVKNDPALGITEQDRHEDFGESGLVRCTLQEIFAGISICSACQGASQQQKPGIQGRDAMQGIESINSRWHLDIWKMIPMFATRCSCEWIRGPRGCIIACFVYSGSPHWECGRMTS